MDNFEILCKPAGTTFERRDSRLVVVSNRVPLPSFAMEPAAGGLAVAMTAALKSRGGLWFGWSGKTGDEGGAIVKAADAVL